MRIAVVGAGTIGQMHAAHLMATDGVTHVELVGRDPGRVTLHAAPVTERAGQAGAGVRLTTSTTFDESLATADGVVITTPGSTHPDLVRRAIRTGSPVFVEKPLTLGASDYARLLDDIEAAGADEKVMVGYHRRHSPEFTALKGVLDSGRAGALRAVFAYDHDKYAADPEGLAGSGGIFADMMAHDFDLIPWLVEEQAESVYAVGSVVAHEEYRRHDQLDTASALLSFSSGLTATISVMRGHASGQDVRTVVHGTDGSFAVGEVDGRAVTQIDVDGQVSSPGRAFEGYQDRFETAFVHEMQDFVALISGRGPNHSTPSSGVHGVELLDAAQRSFASGRPEPVRPLREVSR
ncbi:Gfo/Idh/MocA family protein [Kocuria massiliensis]|uniref:Gfo/Idh/MocA family protein n=1 Tax=Kocuria massiliensis TaxID=1926282 RepID=UPI00117B4160|nr:Gfo/Idh/MocA family oxidoreductase [Kocuria massiliensis]